MDVGIGPLDFQTMNLCIVLWLSGIKTQNKVLLVFSFLSKFLLESVFSPENVLTSKYNTELLHCDSGLHAMPLLQHHCLLHLNCSFVYILRAYMVCFHLCITTNFQLFSCIQ